MIAGSSRTAARRISTIARPSTLQQIGRRLGRRRVLPPSVDQAQRRGNTRPALATSLSIRPVEVARQRGSHAIVGWHEGQTATTPARPSEEAQGDGVTGADEVRDFPGPVPLAGGKSDPGHLSATWSLFSGSTTWGSMRPGLASIIAPVGRRSPRPRCSSPRPPSARGTSSWAPVSSACPTTTR